MVIDKLSLQQPPARSADNLILIDKPAAWSSFDVVKKVRYLTGIKKVGHAGTLDPFATGLLILGTGKKTKQLADISHAAKEYKAVLELGKSTSTYDITGKVTEQRANFEVTDEQIEAVLSSFRGEIEQIPPMFSAKKVNGKRLYKLARQGKEVARKPQRVTIFDLIKLQRREERIELRVRCSKGTYIRSLAHDIGQKLGCGAYLKVLERTAIDNFFISDALSMDAFEKFWKRLN